MPMITYSPKFGMLGDFVKGANGAKGRLADFISTTNQPRRRPAARFSVSQGFLSGGINRRLRAVATRPAVPLVISENGAVAPASRRGPRLLSLSRHGGAVMTLGEQESFGTDEEAEEAAKKKSDTDYSKYFEIGGKLVDTAGRIIGGFFGPKPAKPPPPTTIVVPVPGAAAPAAPAGLGINTTTLLMIGGIGLVAILALKR